MHVCQRWYSCWKHRWKVLAGRSRTASLVAVMTSSAEWNLRLRSSAFMRGKRQKSHGARSGEYGGCGNTVTCCFASFLGEGQSDVQGHCRVATAQDAYDELNCVNNQRSPCSGFCLQLHLLGWIPCEQFHYNEKQFKHHLCLSACLVAVFFCRGDTGVFQVADCHFSCG